MAVNVQQLRELGDHLLGLDSGSVEGRLMHEAVDEIERLRTIIPALRMALVFINTTHDSNTARQKAKEETQRILRAALEKT